MDIVHKNFVKVSYQGIVNIRGPAGAMPVILLKDAKKRTMAIPLTGLESDLIQRALSRSNEGPQLYNTLITCLEKLDVSFIELRILYSKEFDLPTRLILRSASDRDIELVVHCGEGIAYAQLARVPIYVSEELISSVGASAGEAGTSNPS